jgi:hypothetical protein
MAAKSTLLWLAIGAVLGFSVIAILSIGLPFLLLGVILAAIAGPWVGLRGVWAAVVGFGCLPALILVWDLISAPWSCAPPPGVSTSQVGVNYYSCADTFAGRLTTDQVMALFFGLVALIGLVWPLAHRLWERRQHAAA